MMLSVVPGAETELGRDALVVPRTSRQRTLLMAQEAHAGLLCYPVSLGHRQPEVLKQNHREDAA